MIFYQYFQKNISKIKKKRYKLCVILKNDLVDLFIKK